MASLTITHSNYHSVPFGVENLGNYPVWLKSDNEHTKPVRQSHILLVEMLSITQ